MRLGERVAAELRVHRHRRRVHRLDERRALAVPELADVEVAAHAVEVRDADPAEHDVAGGLRQPLALDDPLAVLGERLLPRNGSSTDASASLSCRNSGSLVVAAEHEHDPRARADAADADDLARRVDVAEALEQPPAVGGQGRAGRSG